MNATNATNALMLAQLDAIADYLAEREDVNDGHEGRPEPNEEMCLLRELLWARAHVVEYAAIVSGLAALSDGLGNSNSGAEDAAGKLAERAQKVLEGRA